MVFDDFIEDLKLLDDEEITLLIFGIFSLLFTCSFIFSYIKVFRHILHFSEMPTITITFCYLNNLVWYFYSEQRYHDYMKYCFEASIAVCIIMIFIFLYFQYKEDKIDCMLDFFIILTSSWAIKKLIVDILDDEDKAKITAAISVIVLLCSIIGWIISAYKEKNKKFLNIYSAICLVFLSICGIIFGLHYEELSFFLSNIIGLVVSCIYIFVFYYLKKKYGNIIITPLNDKKEEINDMDIKNRNQDLTSKVYEEDGKDESALLKKTK